MKIVVVLALFAAVVSWCGYVASILLCFAERRPGVPLFFRRGVHYNILLYPSLLTPEGRRSRKRAFLFLAAGVFFILLGALLLGPGHG
jgi:hypothetical protein